MKKIIAFLGLIVVVGTSGCVVSPGHPHAGVTVGVYDEYPHTYYSHGYYDRGHYYWHHPNDRDRYYYHY